MTFLQKGITCYVKMKVESGYTMSASITDEDKYTVSIQEL